MANFLITGARAPVALDLVRNLHEHQHLVWCADSMTFPIAKNSSSIEDYIILPSVKFNFTQYIAKLVEVIHQYNIEFIVPTCEEVFYLAKAKPILERHCTVLCDDFNLLQKLHSKKAILSLAKGLNISLPKTTISTVIELKKKLRDNKNEWHNYVIKPEFCRFGTEVLTNISSKKLAQIADSTDIQYLLQEKIQGSEFCSYGIAHKGILSLNTIYEPTFRVDNTAGIYFKGVKHNQITDFVADFVKKHHFTGQIGFDFIQSEEKLYLIECNPRATSGLHLLTTNISNALKIDLGAHLQGDGSVNLNVDLVNKMIAPAMLMMALPKSIFTGEFREFYRAYKNALDVITSKDDRDFILFTMKSFLELLKRSRTYKCSLRQSTTLDIEWNGDEIS